MRIVCILLVSIATIHFVYGLSNYPISGRPRAYAGIYGRYGVNDNWHGYLELVGLTRGSYRNRDGQGYGGGYFADSEYPIGDRGRRYEYYAAGYGNRDYTEPSLFDSDASTFGYQFRRSQYYQQHIVPIGGYGGYTFNTGR